MMQVVIHKTIYNVMYFYVTHSLMPEVQNDRRRERDMVVIHRTIYNVMYFYVTYNPKVEKGLKKRRDVMVVTDLKNPQLTG